MKQEVKQAIIEAAAVYMSDKGLSQNEFAKITGVNVSYLSSMMKGVFTFVNIRKGEKSEIDDKWFSQLAKTIGYQISKEYWPLRHTDQFINIIKEIGRAHV